MIEIVIVIEIHSSYPDRGNEIFGDSLNRYAACTSCDKLNIRTAEGTKLNK